MMDSVVPSSKAQHVMENDVNVATFLTAVSIVAGW